MQGGARGARRGPAAHRADGRPADRRDDGHRHRAQPVHGAAELQGARTACRSRSSAERLRDPEMRRQILAEHAVGGRDRASWRSSARSSSTALGQVLRHGQSAGLRARPGEERRRDRAARPGRTPDEVAYDYMLEDGQYLYLPGGELRHRRPRADPRDAERPGLPARPVATAARIAPRSSMPALPSYMLTHWGRDRARGPRLPLEHAGQAADQRDRRFLRLRTTAAGSRRGCAPTST